MRSSQTRSSDDRNDSHAKRERDTLWSVYDPYFPPVKPQGSDDRGAQTRTVPFDPHFPARHRH